MGELQLKDDAEGKKPSHYILGDEATDGHTHEFWLRGELPIATTDAELGASEAGSVFGRNAHHAHSIEQGPDADTIMCREMFGHTHTVLVCEEKGSYNQKTLTTEG